MITLLIMTDGRDKLLTQTVASVKSNLRGPISRRVIHTDNGAHHKEELTQKYPEFEILGGSRKGFGGAIHRAWSYVASLPGDYVFHLEDDFLFNRTVHLGDLATVLHYHPYLAQMALVRQAWNDTERQAGGVIQANSEAFTQVTWRGFRWLEHRAFWTTNPALIPKSRIAAGWPVSLRSEGIYSIELFKDPEVQCGYWGGLEARPAVHHIGNQRVGTGY